MNGTGAKHARVETGIIWLASYPKSGNTWFRIFLRNLGIEDPKAFVGLDTIGFNIGSAREVFDHYSGIDSSDLTHDEVASLRSRVFEDIASEAAKDDKGHCFIKVHDACTNGNGGAPLFTDRATAGAIYIIRNPLDIVVSYAFHSGHRDFDAIIARMANPTEAVAVPRYGLNDQVRQTLLDWSSHVRSWVNAPFAVHTMRYEDMKASPLKTFTASARFARIDHHESEIALALDQCRFERLQEAERLNGFHERRVTNAQFFREGKAGGWRRYLSKQQAERVINDHEIVMREYGYLREDGEPVY